jgi:hypothetical protein
VSVLNKGKALAYLAELGFKEAKAIKGEKVSVTVEVPAEEDLISTIAENTETEIDYWASNSFATYLTNDWLNVNVKEV